MGVILPVAHGVKCGIEVAWLFLLVLLQSIVGQFARENVQVNITPNFFFMR